MKIVQNEKSKFEVKRYFSKAVVRLALEIAGLNGGKHYCYKLSNEACSDLLYGLCKNGPAKYIETSTEVKICPRGKIVIVWRVEGGAINPPEVYFYHENNRLMGKVSLWGWE